MSAAAEPLPSGLQLTGLDPEFRADPHSRLDRLRREAPRFLDTSFSPIGALYLTTQADARAALADPTLSRDPRKTPEGTLARTFAPAKILSGEVPAHMLWLDDPEHRINRGLVQPAFFKRCNGMRTRIETIVDELLDSAAAKETFDGIDDFAVPLPLYVISDILGLPRSDFAQFRHWSLNVANLTFTPFRTPEQNATLEANESELEAYFRAAIEARRTAPQDDLISDLLAAELDGMRLSVDALIGICFLMLLAGNLTTTDMIGNGIVALLRHPEELAKLRADPKLARAAVEETLRFRPPVDGTARYAIREETVFGCPVQPGASIVASILAANRDPAVFDDPHVFRLDRGKNEHLAFGGGIHQCLGAPLARLEGEIAFQRLFTRFPKLRLVDENPELKAQFGFCGYERLLLTTA